MAIRQTKRGDALETAIRQAAAAGSFLTTRGLAKAMGIGESSVKRWANDGLLDVVRTVGGHRRIALPEALRFANEVRLSAPGPEVAAREPEPEATPADADATERLFAALMDGDAERARRIVLAEHYLGRSVAEICDGPISGSLARIGEMWRDDEAGGIFMEHRATDICFDVLRRLQSLVDGRTDRAKLAIGCAPGRDIYALPTLAAAVVLMERGFSAVNLGASMPMHVLHRAAKEHRPRIAWLAMNAAARDNPGGNVVEQACTLADMLAEWNGFLVTGGRHVPAELHDARRPNVRCFTSMRELAAFADNPRKEGSTR